jgi:hypothetical protein
VNTKNLELIGILMLIRNGDRGPLTHIRDIDKINCFRQLHDDLLLQALVDKYDHFIYNSTLQFRSIWFQTLGPLHQYVFHNIVSDCKIAQLTRIGVKQLLKTGILLRSAYYEKLNFLNSTAIRNKIIVYSTRYQRTIESAIALLYAFFQNETFQNIINIIFHDSQSLTFCNKNCVCTAAEDFYEQYSEVSIY